MEMQTTKGCHCTVRLGHILVCLEFLVFGCCEELHVSWVLFVNVQLGMCCLFCTLVLYVIHDRFCIKMHVNGYVWFVSYI